MAAPVSLNAMDPNAYGDLKRLARGEQSPEALRAAAKQFEAMFLQMVLKAMRDASPQDGMFDSEQTRQFQQMHDQQLAMDLSQGESGVGLADAIFRQLGGEALEKAAAAGATTVGPDGRTYFDLSNVPRRAAISAAAAPAAEKFAAAATELAEKVSAATREVGSPSQDSSVPERIRGFVGKVWEHAKEAGETLGVPPQFVVAQAALESGWGRAELRKADGTQSHNLFNIKAGRNWNGPVVELPVTEYANGRAYTEKARFRAYGSYGEAFRDYANLLSNSSRYADVLGQTDASAFAGGLQRAGYATDPMYADKLVRIIGGSSLRAAIDS